MTKGNLLNPCKCGCNRIALHLYVSSQGDEKYFWYECKGCGCKTEKYINHYQAMNEWNNGKDK